MSALSPGNKIGPYEITREIGRGGMGVVYLAHDTKLDRDVAIKCLPDELADDVDRLTRFEREAKLLASLNHPNIATIHGLEEVDGKRYLILEYIEGETLEERLRKGAIPVDEALPIAIQIAQAIEAAHDKGVIHRDLKPANIKFTLDEQVKVLDFGLAKAMDEQASSISNIANSPTILREASPTLPGVILGTAGYLSPEQARGRPVDKRTDIFSFGCVLYEMLTGLPSFPGETAADSIGATLHKDVDLSQLPPGTPIMVQHVLRICLERDKNRRMHDIADTRIELELAASGDEADPISMPGAIRTWHRAIPWVIAVAGIIVAVTIGITHFTASPDSPERFVADILPPDGMELGKRLGPIELSPDGRKLAFIAYEYADTPVLCVRDLVSGETTRLDGPVIPTSPFWSPDGRWLAYFSEDRLERIDIRGGRPEVLAVTTSSRTTHSGAWSRDNVIVYSTTRGPLMKVDADGGIPTEAIDLFPERSRDRLILPSFLPDGEHVLFTNLDEATGPSGLYIASIVDGSFKRLLPFETMGRYVEPGWIVFWRAGDLHRQPFDIETLQLTDKSERIASGIWRFAHPVFASFSVAGEGTLAYVPVGLDSDETEFVWYDRESGQTTPLGVEGALWAPNISPDGTRLAFDRTVDATSGDIVVYDLERGIETMLSRDLRNESNPTWTSDSSMIYFLSGGDIYRARSNGMGEPELVYSRAGFQSSPCDISPDGAQLIFSQTSDTRDLKLLNFETGEVADWLSTSFDETNAVFSPDGRWVAYESNAPGETRVMMLSFPDREVMVPVSSGFGRWPRWVADEVFYQTRTELVSVQIEFPEDGPPKVGTPTPIVPAADLRKFSVSPDGRRILLNRSLQSGRGGRIRIVKNWNEEFREQ